MRQRMKLVPLARGRILEVGIGSGLNLGFYDPDHVMKVWGLDPSEEMVAMASGAAGEAPFEVEFILAGGEEIPLASGSVDTVMMTYTLCTIPDGMAALREMARVLAPGGRLLFCEHGLAPDPGVRRWQRWMNPIWKRLGGGCNLDRDIPALLGEAGFEVARLETMYIPGWRPASFNYWGAAVPRR
jgi:ubiquinone/menaquinone biosynthesis C-methylase UbiE